MAATPGTTTPSTNRRRGTKRKTPTPTTTTLRRHQNHRNSTLSPLIPSITTAISAAYSFLLTHDLHLLPSQSLSLESCLSSAAVSLSNLHSTPHHSLSPPHDKPCWFERFLLSASSDDDPRWAPTFRMSKPTFYLLASTLSHSLSSYLPSISPHFALGAALYHLAHNASFCAVGKRFGLSSEDSCRVFYTVCKVICDQLGGYLSLFRSEMEDIFMGFEQISLPNCCGVLGIEKFHLDGDLLGKNGFLMVQALVDSNGRFLDVSAGWPSTFKPNSILPETRLFLSVKESKEFLNGPELELFGGDLIPQYILGDSCYPLLPWLLTPFRKDKNLSLIEMGFNDVHNRAMRFVGMAFERVRANWKLLNRKWKEDFVEFLPFIIITACLLNNFVRRHGEMLPDGDLGRVEEQELPVYDGEVNETALRARDLLALHLSQVSQRK